VTAVGRRGGWQAATALLAAVLIGAACAPSASASTSPPPLTVLLEFDGTGTFSATNGAGTDTPEHTDVALKWSTTYVGKVQSDGSITFQATGPGPGGEVFQTTAPPPGTYHFTSMGLTTADCTGTLPAAPEAPAPEASASNGTLTVQSITSVDQNNQTGQVNCQGTGPEGDAVDLSSDAANLSGTFQPSLPDVLSARISLPPDALKGNTFTQAVSNADAVAQLPSSCADQFGEPEGQCPMSLSWSGTIKITVPCGVVTFSEGDAPAVGTVIKLGDTVSTGANSRVEITLPDGGFYRLGPSSKMQCSGQSTSTEGDRGITDSFQLLLGNMWAGVSSALGGHEFEQQEPTIAGGVRGSAFTASVQRNGDIVYHVIEGTGFIKIKGKREFDYPAGEGVRFDPGYGRYTVTTAWPAADQALVPAAQRPPRLTRVRLVGAHAGKRSTLQFTLNQNATITVQIQRGRHRVLKRTASARHGTRSLVLGALPRGRYTLMLFATVHARSVAVQKSFHVT
jgi:FecR protein